MLLTIIGAGLAGLAALPHGGGKAYAQNITSDTYFYGESPPVYPSPQMTGSGPWAAAFSKAKAMVRQMTLDEKVNLTAGVSTTENSCSGYIPPIPRLDFPGMCLNDAENGLRGADYVSSWPSGLHAGASWNRNLTLLRGTGQGGEFKKKGVNMALGPVAAPLGRVARGGRNWEGFSTDPYLSGALVAQHITGVQGAGVITSTKHFIGYEQETNRNPEGDVQSVSSNIDDRTMHELYLWPFVDAVYAGTGNIMCSYNRVNNSYGCANSKTMNGLLKTELGFQGFVVSDWQAQHAGVATALAGMDMAMPNAVGFWGPDLAQAVTNGSVPESRLTDMATRIIATWYQLGQDQDFPVPGVGMPLSFAAPHVAVDGRNMTFSKPILLQGAVEGHVLVKNVDNALPLKKPTLLSIFGYSAKNPDQNDVGATSVSAWSAGCESYNALEELAGFEVPGYIPQAVIAFNGTLYSGAGSGSTSQSLAVAPFDAIVNRAYEDDTQLFWDFTTGDPVVDTTSDACLVIVNSYASEGWDRPILHDDYTDGLILNVAAQCSNTIVIMHNAGIRPVDQFVDHPNVTALVFAHLPGQASGKALVQLLYGDVNFSGKLPYTLAHNETDYNVENPSEPEGIYTLFPQSNFTEGLFTDYRYFDAYNVTPRYEFGFGLSYTTFSYSKLSVTKAGASTAAASANLWAMFPSGPVAEGGPTDLWDVLATVTAVVTNTGSVEGAEVAQLYVGSPAAGEPLRQLRGFEKPVLTPGESATVTFNLTRRDLSWWNTEAQAWELPRGKFGVWVGGSSRDLPLVGSFVI